MNVEKTIKRTIHDGYYANVFENDCLTLGFTETEFPRKSLETLLNKRPQTIKELKQIHSDRVHLASEIGPPETDRGDGIILNQRGIVALIKTADCTPLFFWDNRGTTGGLLHVGWRGLQQGIETTALEIVKGMSDSFDPERFRFYMGPAIETKCYEVGEDLLEKFKDKSYYDAIFHPIPGKTGKYFMDVKKGIALSLKESGVKPEQISDCGHCTYCLKDRFPSYRREPEKDGRIFSFMILK